MATESFTTLRRVAGVVFSLLLAGGCLSVGAAAQAPAVIPSAVATLSHPSGLGTVYQTALDMQGDWLVVDYSKGTLYEFPANGGPAVALVPVGSLGGYQNPGVAVDSQNNLYLEGNWSNCLLRFPYDPATQTWPGLATITTSAPSSNCAAPYNWAQYGLVPWNWGFQPWGLGVDKNDNLVIANQVGGNWSFTLGVDGSGLPVNPVEIIDAMTARASSVAVDPWLNSYFVEEPDSGPLNGVLEVPAGSKDIPNDTNLTNVAPAAMQVTTGVAADLAGNLYASDKVGGIYVIPNPNGTPDTANAFQVTPTNGAGAVAVDSMHHIMYVPTTSYDAKGEPVEQQMRFGNAEFGSVAIGTAAPNPVAVQYTFTGATGMTLARATIVEDGVATPDFAISGGTCVTGVTSTTAYGGGGSNPASCVVNVTMTPHNVGAVSGKLLLQSAQQVPGGSAGATASISQYAATGTIVTLTAANTFVAGEPVVITATGAGNPLAPLNGQSFAVLPSGLSSKQFEIQTPLLKATAAPAAASATAAGYQFTTVASMQLHGVGLGPLILTAPSVESAIGSGLQAPTQIAIDALGNIYIADPGAGKVLMYAAGSDASASASFVGTGLQTPTGVAVDGSGDVFIADSATGSIIEIPYLSTGINTDGGQLTVATGLGGNLRLAADGLGNLYAADPSNGRVVVLSNVGQSGAGILGQTETFLTKGFTAPSAVAVDSNNSLYVIDGAKLFEFPNGERWVTTLMTTLSGATGLAVDPSGAVYVTSNAATERIPSLGGVLTPASATTVAADLTNVSAVAIDSRGNAYLTPAAGGSATLVQTNGALTFAPFTDPTQTATLDFAVINAGNAPLKVTGYNATNPTVNTVSVTDFTAADGTCISSSPIAAGGSCQVAVTLAPGPGEQGPVSSQITLASTSVNSPVVSATGVAAGLANSATTISMGSLPEVVHTPLTVTVSSKSGGATPTGQVAVTYTSWYVANSTCAGQSGCSSVPTVYPQSATVTSNLSSDGTASFILAPVLAGTQTISATYVGDRVYGRSTGTSAPTVAKSAISGLTMPPSPDPTDIYLPLILGQSGATPYDGSQVPFQYKLKVIVDTAAGIPVGTLTFTDNSSACPPGTSANGQGAATCALANYSGIACPYSAGDGTLNIQNSGTATGAQASFNAPCLYNQPANSTYTPVIFTHYITPSYSGDANFLPYTGAAPVLIQITRSPLVQITTANPSSATQPPSLTIHPGSSASLDLTLTSVLGYGIAGRNGALNDYNFPVTLACTNLPPHAACSFTYPNPNPLMPTAVDIPCPSTATTTQIAAGQASCTQGQATVTIYTDVTAGTTTAGNAARTASVTLAAIFGFGMFGLFFRRRSLEKASMMLMVFLMVIGIALAGSITACSTSTFGPAAGLSTPTGTYAVTISAQQVGQQCIAQTSTNANCTTASGQSGILAYGSQNQVSLPFTVNVTIQ